MIFEHCVLMIRSEWIECERKQHSVQRKVEKKYKTNLLLKSYAVF